MSETIQHPTPEAGGTTLHLGKIISQQTTEPPTALQGEESGTMIIKKAAAQVAKQNPQGVVLPKGGAGAQAVPPPQLLGAVAYAYSKGVYRSEDIEEKMLQDPAVRKALGGEIPDARAIRRFRYLNHEALLATLEKFYFWKRKKVSTRAAHTEQPPAPASPASPQEEPSTVFIRHEAAAKLDEAACVDNMLKDS